MSVEHAAAILRRQPDETVLENIRGRIVLLRPARRKRTAGRHFLAQAWRKIAIARRVVLANDPEVGGAEGDVYGHLRVRVRRGADRFLAVPLALVLVLVLVPGRGGRDGRLDQ